MHYERMTEQFVLYNDDHYEGSSLKEQLTENGYMIKEVTIMPEVDYFSNSIHILLDRCENIESFNVENNQHYEFKNGVLYSVHQSDGMREIVFMTHNVTNLHIEENVTGLGHHWTSLEHVSVDENNTEFAVSDCLLMSHNMDTVYLAFADSKEIVVPEGVLRIHNDAFKYCGNLECLVLPESFGWDAWPQRTSPVFEFKDDIIPKFVIKGDMAEQKDNMIIKKYYSLQEPVLYLGDPDHCYIPDYLKNISTLKFSFVFRKVNYFDVSPQNPELSSVDGVVLDKTGTKLIFYPHTRDYFNLPETVKVITGWSVSDCDYLTVISIPDHVEEIEDHAFSDDENLVKVSFLSPRTKVAELAFVGCPLESTGGVRYSGCIASDLDYENNSEIVIREGTTELRAGRSPEMNIVTSFDPRKARLQDLYLPSSLSSIQGWLNIPMSKIIVDAENPYYCSIDGVLFTHDLKTLVRYPMNKAGQYYSVPEGVEIIAESAFHNCTQLKHVTLPGSIDRIGDYAFSETELLTLELPAKPVSIGAAAIRPASYYRYGGKVVNYTSQLRFVHENIKIPLEVLENWRVNKNEIMLAEFVEADDVGRKKSIFSDVKTPGYKRFMAFYLSLVHGDAECTNYLSRMKKKLSEDAIYSSLIECLNTEQIKRAPKKSSQKSFFSKWSLRQLPDGNYEIEKYKGKDLNVEIPGEYNGVKIISIGENALSVDNNKACAEIETIKVPEGIASIKEKAFAGCNNLQEIELPDSLADIEARAFYYCVSLKSVKLPEKVIIINKEVFKNCKSINSVMMSSPVISIEQGAFYGCEALETIGLPEGLKSIGTSAFYTCGKLTHVQLPQTLETMGMSAFGYCRSLEAVHVPEKTSIDVRFATPFGNCNKLKEITVDDNNKEYASIDGVLFDKTKKKLLCYPNGKGTSYTVPQGVEVIGKNAFDGCRMLDTVIISDGVRRIEEAAFSRCMNLEKIIIPSTVEYIGDWALPKTSKCIVYTPSGSPTEEYCNKNELQVRDLEMIAGQDETIIEELTEKGDDISAIFDSTEGFSFDGQVVCLTGDFDYGAKSEVISFIESQGGSVSSSVTKKTTVVLMGNRGSDAWSHGNYGRKIEKALERKKAKNDIQIVKESKELFASDLSEKEIQELTNPDKATIEPGGVLETTKVHQESSEETKDTIETNEMNECLKKLCERYIGKQKPKDLKAIKEDNPDLPVSKLNSYTVKKYGKKLVKYITEIVIDE